MTIHTLWKQTLNRHANLPALSWVGETPWTYAELNQKVEALQALWASWGVAAGGRVALWSTNHPAWGAVYLSVTTSGRVIVPVLPDFSAVEMANVMRHSGATVLVVGPNQAELVPEGLEGVRIVRLEELLSLSALPAVPFDPPQSEDLAALIYTSGTTGAPKGVMLTHVNIAGNASASSPIPGYAPGDKQLSVLPLAHTYECTLGFLVPLIEGVHISYLNKPPIPSVLLPALAVVKPHAMLSVPLLMEKIYRAKVQPGLTKGVVGFLSHVPGLKGLLIRVAGKKLYQTFGGRLKFFGVGGAPLAPEVEQFLFKAKFPYAIGYGLTETSPLVAGHLKGRLYSTGRVLPGVEVRISELRNPQGAGEILVRGPNVMRGYYQDPERTAEVLSPDGWFRTGDLGQFDRHGHLHIKGRLKNVILGPSGENIYPEAVEALLNRHEAVAESLVLQRGTELIAKVVLSELVGTAELPGPIDPERLRVAVNEHLARYSRISRIELQEQSFEKTATLKIKRYLYR